MSSSPQNSTLEMYGPSQEFIEERRRNSKKRHNLRRRANRKKRKVIDRLIEEIDQQHMEENESCN